MENVITFITSSGVKEVLSDGDIIGAVLKNMDDYAHVEAVLVNGKMFWCRS